MGRFSLNSCVWFAMAGIGLYVGNPHEGFAQYPGATLQGSSLMGNRAKPSITESITSKVKQGVGKITSFVTPKTPVKPADDPVSILTPAKPGPELYVRVARLCEESGKLPLAIEHYQRALKRDSDYLGALLGCARLKDHLGDREEARRLYLQAARAHPNEAPVYNNLGLFYEKHGMHSEALAAFQRAIELQPNSAKYRNNVAKVLVEQGKTQEAFSQLHTVHREAVAYYNLGFLLEMKGQAAVAERHYTAALQFDPSSAPAKRRVERLRRLAVQAHEPVDRMDAGARLSSRNLQAAGPSPRQAPAARGDVSSVRQLPPPPGRRRTFSGTPSGFRGSPGNDMAPLPPSFPALRRLPPTSANEAVPPTPAPMPLR